jgi:hypothetical protein
MELGPSWETNSHSFTKEFYKIFRNLNIHNLFTRALYWSVLSQVNPVHTTPSYCSNIDFNIILPPSPGLPTGLFLLLPPKRYAHYVHHEYYMPCRSRLSRQSYSNYIWRRMKIMSSSLCNFSLTYYLIPFGPDIFASILSSNKVNSCSSFNATDYVSQSYKTTGKTSFL